MWLPCRKPVTPESDASNMITSGSFLLRSDAPSSVTSAVIQSPSTEIIPASKPISPPARSVIKKAVKASAAAHTTPTNVHNKGFLFPFFIACISQYLSLSARDISIVSHGRQRRNAIYVCRQQKAPALVLRAGAFCYIIQSLNLKPIIISVWALRGTSNTRLPLLAFASAARSASSSVKSKMSRFSAI